MIVLSTETYEKICDFFKNTHIMSMGCEEELEKQFSYVEAPVLGAILSKKRQKHIKNRHHLILKSAPFLLKKYKQHAEKTGDAFILVKMAERENFSAVCLCRILLSFEYEGRTRQATNEMLRNPHLIPDPLLALNVLNCVFNDTFDGPLIDLKRQAIGEDYEVRLKKFASDAGLEFHDEVHLRRYGYDKTPDLKLAVPCLFKGKVINWIESKALFGDMSSHRQYVNDQLASYGNRFGNGIIIYWFGHLDEIATCPENKDFIIVCDEFPKKEELVVLNLPYK